MLHTVLALVQDKRRFNIIVVSLAFALGCFTSTCVAQSTTVRIRFADGKSGKPLHLKYYDQGTGAVAAGNYKVDKVDGDSLIVTFNNVSTIAFRSDAYEPCDAKGKHAPDSSTAFKTSSTMVSSHPITAGMLTPNLRQASS